MAAWVRESRLRWKRLLHSPSDNSTAGSVPPPDGSLDGEEENDAGLAHQNMRQQGNESGRGLGIQGQPSRYAPACENTEDEDTLEFEEEALRELEDSLQQLSAREEEALSELEDVLRLVREAADGGTDRALTSAKQEELVKQLEDLGITWRCEGNDGDELKMRSLAVLPALLGSKGLLGGRPRPQVQEEPMRLDGGNIRQGAKGTAKGHQRQKVKAKQRCFDDAHDCPESGDVQWPERGSVIKVEESQVLTKPGTWPSSLYSCAACFTVESF